MVMIQETELFRKGLFIFILPNQCKYYNCMTLGSRALLSEHALYKLTDNTICCVTEEMRLESHSELDGFWFLFRCSGLESEFLRTQLSSNADVSVQGCSLAAVRCNLIFKVIMHFIITGCIARIIFFMGMVLCGFFFSSYIILSKNGKWSNLGSNQMHLVQD
jgi:hypothetical protein